MQCYPRKASKNVTKMAHNSNTNATAMACNSTPDTLVLKTRKAEMNRKGTELPSNPKPVTPACWSIFTLVICFFPHDRSRQVNRRCTRKHGPWPSKLVKATPQESLSGDLLLGDSMLT